MLPIVSGAFGEVPIQDHTLHNIREFTNFSTSHVIPNILEKLIKMEWGSMMDRDVWDVCCEVDDHFSGSK